jgi:hypothetical protein
MWQDGLIVTRVALAIEERFKGPANQRIEFFIPGGEIGGMRMVTTDMPNVAPGERVLVFLARNPSGRLRVFGAVQGKFDVTRDPRTGAWMSRNSAVDVTEPSAGPSQVPARVVAPRNRDLALEKLTASIHAWLNRSDAHR